MELEISKTFKEILRLAVFDQDTNTYYLSKQNYEILGLTDEKRRTKINKLFSELNINLDYPKKILPEIKDEYLFEEYNQIKSKLESNLSQEEKEQLEQRRIILRNKITEDNLDFIKVIINRRLYDIHNNIDKEDIYQFGYLMLFKYIDKSYLDKEKFKYEINCRIILYLENQILHSKKNISSRQGARIDKYQQVKEQTTTKDKISEELNLKESQINTLINLENILSSISIEELTDIDEQSEETSREYMTQLYDENYEDRLIEQLEIAKCINLIVKTFPKEKQKIINLYYGLNGSSKYNTVQIANMLGLTRARISSIIIESFQLIKSTLIMKYMEEYLQDIYTIDTSNYQEQSDKLNFELEEMLIKNLPQNIIDKLTLNLKVKQRKFFELFFQENNYTMTEISKLLNISIAQLYQIKKQTIKKIRENIIEEQLLFKENKTITYDIYYQYIKYLINIYSHQIEIKEKGLELWKRK